MAEFRFTDPHREEGDRLKRSFLPGLLFVGLMWLVFVPAYFLDLHLGHLGLYPRRTYGLLGILTSPLLHADWSHLLSNTFPLPLLAAMVFYMFPKASGRLMAWLYLLSGVLAWFMARPAYHIGASGIIYGMASLMFFSGMFRRDRTAVVFSVIIAFLYGGMLYGIFPTEGRVSWESHLAGGIAGFLLAFFYRNTDLPPVPPAPVPEPEIPEPLTHPPHINASFTGQPQIVIRYTFRPVKPETPALPPPEEDTFGS
ncbi:MAG TPA: rhomboid family intramembrane serine protease [Adhaeribacter sp.]|nr:rhomboid family intramembrane serine protease [Adhaeribacter sp.]